MDSILFVTIAFAFVYTVEEILIMIATQTVLKTVYEIIIFPVTRIIINKVKKVENIDTFDVNIKYNPWMQNYDIVDLARLKVEVIKQHENNVQAITLNEDIHKELHRRFGKNVTPEQLEAFKAEYNKVKATA